MPTIAETLLAADPMTTQPLTIGALRQETADTFTLTVEPGDNAFPFTAGQFNMLYAFGVGEVAISISGDPMRPDRLVHTIRRVGPTSNALGRLERGDHIGVRGPFGIGWPLERAVGKDVVIVAGGIGLAPLRPAIYHVLAQRRRFRRLVILYGARTPADVLFAHELERWRQHEDCEIGITVDRTGSGWHGNIGVVTELIPAAGFDPRNAVAMLCGPEIMMRFTALELRKRGMRTAQIYVSMERNMKCAIGFCGHCQFGPDFVCRDGPVFPLHRIRNLIARREV